MKVAVTAQGPERTSPVDAHFGRARCFVVVDTDTGQAAAHDNTQNLNAPQGAGIQAGRHVVELGAEAVLTSHVGPKAFATLVAGNVRVYVGASGTVAEAIEQFEAGTLRQVEAATVEGHWI